MNAINKMDETTRSDETLRSTEIQKRYDCLYSNIIFVT